MTLSHNRLSPQTKWTAAKHPDFRKLADVLLLEDASAISMCVEFVCSETRNIGDGRARALMCRRMKHIRLSEEHSVQLSETIGKRFASGLFSEQFKDQLRLAMILDPDGIFKLAQDCQSHQLAHVRRYAQWVLQHKASWSASDQ